MSRSRSLSGRTPPSAADPNRYTPTTPPGFLRSRWSSTGPASSSTGGTLTDHADREHTPTRRSCPRNASGETHTGRSPPRGPQVRGEDRPGGSEPPRDGGKLPRAAGQSARAASGEPADDVGQGAGHRGHAVPEDDRLAPLGGDREVHRLLTALPHAQHVGEQLVEQVRREVVGTRPVVEIERVDPHLPRAHPRGLPPGHQPPLGGADLRVP